MLSLTHIKQIDRKTQKKELEVEEEYEEIEKFVAFVNFSHVKFSHPHNHTDYATHIHTHTRIQN